MDSRVAAKIFCGLSLQKACVVVGVFNLIVAGTMAISSIVIGHLIWVNVPLAVIEILLVTTMIVGANKQNVRLMRPYVVVKLTLLVVSTVLYVIFIILYYGMLLYLQKGGETESQLTLLYMFVGISFKCESFFALNIIPVLVVWTRIMDLRKERRNEASHGTDLEQARSEENVPSICRNETKIYEDIRISPQKHIINDR